jgi:hypothetical protein
VEGSDSSADRHFAIYITVLKPKSLLITAFRGIFLVGINQPQREDDYRRRLSNAEARPAGSSPPPIRTVVFIIIINYYYYYYYYYYYETLTDASKAVGLEVNTEN